MAETNTEDFLEDASMQPLVQENFDPKKFATQTIQSQMVGETLGKLTVGLASLDRELYSQVVTNYEDLLSQATGIESLESVFVFLSTSSHTYTHALSHTYAHTHTHTHSDTHPYTHTQDVLKMMHTRIESLRTAVDRISFKIVDPYQKIVSRTAQSNRLQAACDLLRKVIRILYLIKRLQSQMQGGSREITKVAQTFSEIDQLMADGDLEGVYIIEEEKPWLNRTRREVETQAKRMLLQGGLELMNPTQVGVSLQVFYNLQQLPNALNSVLTGFRDALQHEIQNALDPATLIKGVDGGSGPGRPTLPALGSSASWKASLWTRLDKLVNEIHKIYKQVHQLHIVLLKKKDPVSQVSFLEIIVDTDVYYLLTHFWESVAEDLAVEFAAAAQASTFLRQTFENEYPKLVRVFSDLLFQLEQLSVADTKTSAYLSTMSTVSESVHESSSYETALLKALSPFEKAYVSRSQSRLLDSINQLFGPASKLPREEEILHSAKTISSELFSAGGSRPLARIISKNADKAIRLFNMKCDELVASGKEAVQVFGPPNHAQHRNIAVANTLHIFHCVINQQILGLSTLHQIPRAILSLSLEQTLTHLRAIVNPFLTEMQRMLEKMVESMHQENFAGDLKRDMVIGSPDSPCSGFMKEMQGFTGRMYAQHISQFHCNEEIRQQLTSVTERVLDLYIRHICLIRPLEEAGKMRITTDMAQIELALAPFCQRLADLGMPYKRLRALRRLMFIATDHLLLDDSGLVGDPLPLSYILNFLFSRAPSDLKSPHKVQGWTEKEYSDWMDSHPMEGDKLAFLQATLDTYSNRIKAQGHIQTPPIYTSMVQLLKKGFDQLK